MNTRFLFSSVSFFIFTLIFAASSAHAENDPHSELALKELNANHELWVKTLRDDPSHFRRHPAHARRVFGSLFKGRNKPFLMRCWVSGFSGVLGIQHGLCKSAGRKYALSQISLGSSVEAHAGRLRLKADRPFPDSIRLHGAHGRLYIFVGAQRLRLSNRQGTDVMQVRGSGWGVGAGGGVGYAWVMLTRLGVESKTTKTSGED